MKRGFGLCLITLLAIFSTASSQTDYQWTKIYDTCLVTHLNYLLASHSKDRNLSDTCLYVLEDENYRGHKLVTAQGFMLQFVSKSELYKEASERSIHVIKFQEVVFSKDGIEIPITNFYLKKKSRKEFDWANLNGSRHFIHFDCSKNIFRVTSSREEGY